MAWKDGSKTGDGKPSVVLSDSYTIHWDKYSEPEGQTFHVLITRIKLKTEQ